MYNKNMMLTDVSCMLTLPPLYLLILNTKQTSCGYTLPPLCLLILYTKQTSTYKSQPFSQGHTRNSLYTHVWPMVTGTV